MGLVKTRRLAAMQKQQRAKAGMKPPVKKGLAPHFKPSRTGRPAEWLAGSSMQKSTARGLLHG